MNGGTALPNVGPGPDPLSLRALETDFAVVLLHRDFYCSECRQQVRRVKRRYGEFEQRNVEVVSVLPEDRETAEEWQKQYHLPFPVLADAEKQWGERFDQPRKYGLLGRLHDVIGRMPAAVVIDLRWSDPIETFAHRGDAKTDRPRVDELLAAVDDAADLAADSTPEQRDAAARAAAEGDPTAPHEPRGGGASVAAPETGDPPETGAGDHSPEAEEAGEADEAAEIGEAPETVETAEPAETTAAPEVTESSDTPEATEPGGSDQRADRSEAADVPAPDEPERPDGDAEILEDDAGERTEGASPPAAPREPVPVPDAVELPETVELRRAESEDAMPVVRVLHGALLEIDGETVRRAVARGDVLVAAADGWVVGALVLEDNHVHTLAVRREHRGQGIGSALVEAAVADVGGPVTAEFRAGVRGFWADLGFEIEREGDRFYGIRR